MTDDQAERVAKALESIARSLQHIAHPPVGITAEWAEPTFANPFTGEELLGRCVHHYERLPRASLTDDGVVAICRNCGEPLRSKEAVSS